MEHHTCAGARGPPIVSRGAPMQLGAGLGLDPSLHTGRLAMIHVIAALVSPVAADTIGRRAQPGRGSAPDTPVTDRHLHTAAEQSDPGSARSDRHSVWTRTCPYGFGSG